MFYFRKLKLIQNNFYLFIVYPALLTPNQIWSVFGLHVYVGNIAVLCLFQISQF